MNDRHPKPELPTGDVAYDLQRRKLLALCQQASRLTDDKNASNKEQFHIILNDLAIFAREHFQSEEALLRRHNPALLDSHMAEHISYESQLTDLLIMASNGIFDKAKLLHLLTEWWSSPAHHPSATPLENAMR